MVVNDVNLVLSPGWTHRRSVIILTMSRAGRLEHICWKRGRSFCYVVGIPKKKKKSYLNKRVEKGKCSRERKGLMETESRQQDMTDSRRKGLPWQAIEQRERQEGS